MRYSRGATGIRACRPSQRTHQGCLTEHHNLRERLGQREVLHLVPDVLALAMNMYLERALHFFGVSIMHDIGYEVVGRRTLGALHRQSLGGKVDDRGVLLHEELVL